MDSIEVIEGFWKVVAYEQGGIPRSGEECQRRACLVLCSDKVVPGSDGIWGEIKYHNQPTPEIAIKSLRSLRQLINGQDYERSQDYYLYSGGIVYLGVSEDGTASVDLVVYHGSHLYSIEPEHSVSRGIFRFDGKYLTVCLVDANTKTRPLRFGSTETPYQSLTMYVREEYSRSISGRGAADNMIAQSEPQSKPTLA